MACVPTDQQSSPRCIDPGTRAARTRRALLCNALQSRNILVSLLRARCSIRQCGTRRATNLQLFAIHLLLAEAIAQQDQIRHQRDTFPPRQTSLSLHGTTAAHHRRRTERFAAEAPLAPVPDAHALLSGFDNDEGVLLRSAVIAARTTGAHRPWQEALLERTQSGDVRGDEPEAELGCREQGGGCGAVEPIPTEWGECREVWDPDKSNYGTSEQVSA